jgi:glutathione peroxidase
LKSVYDFTVAAANGKPAPMSAYKGKVLLIVNTASRCGFTPQYAGLEALWRKHKDEGLEVLGFPCNQFGGQEPGDANDIANFCAVTYDVTFPVLAKIDVKGPTADPLYKYLTHAKRGLFGSSRVKWNFTKFLIGRDGKVLHRYGPGTKPEAIEGAIVKALKAR